MKLMNYVFICVLMLPKVDKHVCEVCGESQKVSTSVSITYMVNMLKCFILVIIINHYIKYVKVVDGIMI
jgi:transcription elongation factor Elf1